MPFAVQAGRLGGKLEKSFANILDRQDYDVRLDPSALAPERALVFEVIGSVANFANSAQRIELEWLAEQLSLLDGVEDYLSAPPIDDEDDEEDEISDDEEDLLGELMAEDEFEATTIGRLYVGMPTLATYKKLRTLWDQFKEGKPFPPKHSDWWGLFSKLHDLRPWGPADRVPQGLIDYVSKHLQETPLAPIQIEIDLWYRGEVVTRAAALQQLEARINELGGEILDIADIGAVRYHAALVRLPAEAARDLASLGGELASADEVMGVRPQSLFNASQGGEPLPLDLWPTPEGIDSSRPALAALIDGYPIENHELLKDRIDVIELDVLSAQAPVLRRFHGTAMASLILHGDIADGQPSLNRLLKIIPILQPDSDGNETPPPDKLALGVIYRAVQDLKKGTGGQPPTGENVIIINHSVCDESAPFSGNMSAWARTLDHLAFTYKILFVVSAGNIKTSFPIASYSSIAAFRDGIPAERTTAIINGLDQAKSQRTLLSPGESVNALTVGAAHTDSSIEALPANAINPFPDHVMSNLGSGVGLGFDRAVKPDVLMPGGRQIAQPTLDAVIKVHAMEAGAYGQCVASPGVTLGSLTRTRRTSGTSNAAALATRAGLLIADALDETFENEPWFRRPTAPCMLKALIAHGGSWGVAGEKLADIIQPLKKNKQRQRENISRHLGYGLVDLDRILSADQHRITLLADDVIRANKRHEYRIPLPSDLRSKTEIRRVTMTLGWLSPPLPGSANYRALGLGIVGVEGKSKIWTGVKRFGAQPPLGASRRGTLMHMICEGRSAIPFEDDEHFIINVQTAAPRTSGLTKVDIPYALAVTFEVAASLNADIRSEMRNRIQPRLRAS